MIRDRVYKTGESITSEESTYGIRVTDQKALTSALAYACFSRHGVEFISVKVHHKLCLQCSIVH